MLCQRVSPQFALYGEGTDGMPAPHLSLRCTEMAHMLCQHLTSVCAVWRRHRCCASASPQFALYGEGTDVVPASHLSLRCMETAQMLCQRLTSVCAVRRWHTCCTSVSPQFALYGEGTDVVPACLQALGRLFDGGRLVGSRTGVGVTQQHLTETEHGRDP